jgi:hypothetical protein
MTLPAEERAAGTGGPQKRNIEKGGTPGHRRIGEERKILEQGTAMGMENFGD